MAFVISVVPAIPGFLDFRVSGFPDFWYFEFPVIYWFDSVVFCDLLGCWYYWGFLQFGFLGVWDFLDLV